MPEGDTIHRAAAALRTALVDKKMVRFEAPRLIGVVPRAGRTIERVESHGKHLEIEWDDGIILHTHMRMSGSWHLYRKDDSWQRPHREMRALIEVPDWTAVCFNAPVVETYRGPTPTATRARAARARPVPRRRRSRPLRRAAARLRRPAGDRGRGAARPAGVLRGRQRLSLRGPVGVRAEPVRPGRRRSPRPTPCASSTSPPSLLRANLPTPSGSPCPACRAGSPSTGAPGSAASGAPRPSRPAGRAATPGSCTGARVPGAARSPAPRRRRPADGPSPGGQVPRRRPPLARRAG